MERWATREKNCFRDLALDLVYDLDRMEMRVRRQREERMLSEELCNSVDTIYVLLNETLSGRVFFDELIEHLRSEC